MSEENPSGWAVGWSMFAAVMLFIAGTLQFLAGLSAVLNDDYFVISDDYAFNTDQVTFRAILRADGALINTDAIKHFANSAT